MAPGRLQSRAGRPHAIAQHCIGPQYRQPVSAGEVHGAAVARCHLVARSQGGDREVDSPAYRGAARRTTRKWGAMPPTVTMPSTGSEPL